MNLVYVWFEKCRCFEKQGFILNNNYKVIKTEDYSFQISKEEKYSLYKNDKILDAYVLLGKNGRGKSTLLDVIALGDFGVTVGTEGEYFLIYEEQNKYYVLYSYNFMHEIQCKINDKEYPIVCEINGMYGTGIIFNDRKHLCSLAALIKYEEGYPKFRTLNYERREHFLSPSLNSNIFEFIYRLYNEEKILNFDSDREIKTTFKSDINLQEFGFYKQKKYNLYDYELSYEGNTRLEIIRYYFLNRYLDMCSLNYISDKIKDTAINIESVIEKLEEIDKVDDLIDYSLYVLETINGIENNYEYYNRFKVFVEKLNKLTFIRNEYADLYFKLSDVTESNYNDILEFVKSTNYVFLEPNGNQFRCNIDGSSGEKALIEILACINTVIEKFNNVDGEKTCVLCLDELEQCMHPEWSRILFTKIYELINFSANKHKYYIYLSTHAPYIISDFTHDHVISLEGSNFDFHTFAASIYDILSNGMFLTNSMGEFAYKKILKVIELLNSDNEINRKEIEYIIDSVGEPIIKSQLKLLYKKYIEKNISDDKRTKYAYKTKEELIDLLMELDK